MGGDESVDHRTSAFSVVPLSQMKLMAVKCLFEYISLHKEFNFSYYNDLTVICL